jgi:hypothetical protein
LPLGVGFLIALCPFFGYFALFPFIIFNTTHPHTQQHINGTPSKPKTMNRITNKIIKILAMGPQNTQQTNVNIANAIAIRKK